MPGERWEMLFNLSRGEIAIDLLFSPGVQIPRNTAMKQNSANRYRNVYWGEKIQSIYTNMDCFALHSFIGLIL